MLAICAIEDGLMLESAGEKERACCDGSEREAEEQVHEAIDARRKMGVNN